MCKCENVEKFPLFTVHCSLSINLQMRTILTIIRKEFLQIFRNKISIPILFVVPIVQLIIIVNAATLEIKHLKMAVVDLDLSATSRKMIEKFEGTNFYKVEYQVSSYNEALRLLDNGEIDLIVNIPNNFERQLVRDNSAKVQLSVNAINGTTAAISAAYLANIILDFNKDIVVEHLGKSITSIQQQRISVIPAFWYNTELNYTSYMVPAILVILVTMIGMFLAALNLVREKEMGTIEQINVTPIRKYEFIIGKLVPFWILALIEFSLGLGFGKLVYDIPIVGSLPLLYLAAGIYLVIVLGLGLLISTVTNTQQQAMFITFFVMMVCVMMSGIFTSVETMPKWGQYVDLLNPVFYFMKCVRMILLKGSSFMDIKTEIISMFVFGIVVMTLAVTQYRKTT